MGYDNFVLMHENARAHTATTVIQYLEDVGVETLDWPPMSLDANPIEHIWDILKRRIWARNPAPNSIAELRIAAQEELNRLPQETIQDILQSMPRRMQAIVRARGGNTKLEELLKCYNVAVKNCYIVVIVSLSN